MRTVRNTMNWFSRFSDGLCNESRARRDIQTNLLFRDDLFSRQDQINESFLSAFVIAATHYLVGGLARGLTHAFAAAGSMFSVCSLVERAYFTDVITVEKLLLKYLLHVLPTSTEQNRVNHPSRFRSFFYLVSVSVGYSECDQISLLLSNVSFVFGTEGLLGVYQEIRRPTD